MADVDLFLDGCAALTADNGAIALAILNRTPKSFALGIGANTSWLRPAAPITGKFVRPSEVAHGLRRNGITVEDISGLTLIL